MPRKIRIALDKQLLEDIVKIAKREGKVKVYIAFTRKPLSEHIDALIGQIYFYPEIPSLQYYEIEVTSTMTVNDIIKRLKDEIYDLIGEYPEVILFEEKAICIDKERKRPTSLLETQKAVCYTLYIVNGEPVYAHIYDAELKTSYDVTTKEALRKIQSTIEKYMT